ncbi:hypothetical protein IWZ01DRAFT_523632 [Phyllosticta capitalensis]
MFMGWLLLNATFCTMYCARLSIEDVVRAATATAAAEHTQYHFSRICWSCLFDIARDKTYPWASCWQSEAQLIAQSCGTPSASISSTSAVCYDVDLSSSHHLLLSIFQAPSKCRAHLTWYLLLGLHQQMFQLLTANQITYIGIPLTVLGLMPIFWNIAKAFWIRFKLSRSIPWELRDYYNLITDPAAGTVTVVAPKLWIVDDFRNFFEFGKRSHTSSSKCGRHRVFHRLIEAFTWRISTGLKAVIKPLRSSPKGEDRSPSLEAATEEGFEEDQIQDRIPALESYSKMSPPLDNRIWAHPSSLLYRPWMTLAMSCNFEFQPQKSGEFENEETRFNVNIDWKIETPPRLKIGWTEFVFLASGFGANFFRFDPTKEEEENPLKSCLRDDMFLFHASYGGWIFQTHSGHWHSFSIRTALAWYDLMLLEHDDGTRTCLSISTAEPATPGIFNPRAGCENELPGIFSVFDSSLEEILEPLSAAVTWMFYQNKCRELGDRFFPVNQQLQEARENVLWHFQTLKDEGRLEVEISATLAQPPSEPDNQLCEKILEDLRKALSLSLVVRRTGEIHKNLAIARKNIKEHHDKHISSECGNACSAMEAARNEIDNVVREPIINPRVVCHRAHRPSLEELLKQRCKAEKAHYKVEKVKARFDPHLCVKNAYPYDF